MHVSHIICMVSYFAYFSYQVLHMHHFHISFCNLLSKKGHCHIKHQILKHPTVGDIIHSAFPLHMDIQGYPCWE